MYRVNIPIQRKNKHSLWVFAEEGLDEVDGCLVQALQLFLSIVDVDLGDVEESLLLVVPEERGDACEHHVG